MIPISVSLRSDHAADRTFNFRVVKDQLFTPLMTQTMLLNLFDSYERQFGASTFGLSGTVDIANHGAVSLDNVFAGDNAGSLTASAIVAPLAALLTNDFEKVDVKGLKLVIDSTEAAKTATLERAWIDDPRPRAGRTVPLKLVVRSHRGDDVVHTVPIEIPANARGSVSVVIADGARLAQSETAEVRQGAARSVPQIVRQLNNARRNDRLYVRLVSADAGAVVRGERLASLPPSILAVVDGDRSSSGSASLNTSTLGEWTIATGQAVSGNRTLTVSLTPN
jgi:hypothetical protein